jgi:hypothetical protein
MPSLKKSGGRATTTPWLALTNKLSRAGVNGAAAPNNGAPANIRGSTLSRETASIRPRVKTSRDTTVTAPGTSRFTK